MHRRLAELKNRLNMLKIAQFRHTAQIMPIPPGHGPAPSLRLEIKNKLLFLNDLTEYFRKSLDYPQPIYPARGYDPKSEG